MENLARKVENYKLQIFDAAKTLKAFQLLKMPTISAVKLNALLNTCREPMLGTITVKLYSITENALSGFLPLESLLPVRLLLNYPKNCLSIFLNYLSRIMVHTNGEINLDAVAIKLDALFHSNYK